MKHYLVASRGLEGHLDFHLTTSPLSARGSDLRASPIFRWDGTEPPSLDTELDYEVLSLYPVIPTTTINRTLLLVADHPDWQLWLTHGLACALVVAPAGELGDCSLIAQDLDCVAHEVWKLCGGRVSQSDIQYVEHVDAPAVSFPEIETDGLGHLAAIEVRQFNFNLWQFWSTAGMFAPEYFEMAEWTHTAVRDIADHLHALDLVDDSLDKSRAVNAHSTLLVEINSCLTSLHSQLGSVRGPLMHRSFPVGEYALFGLGSAARAAWALYRHLNHSFGSFDLVGRIDSAENLPLSFDPGLSPGNHMPSEWEHHPVKPLRDPPASPAEMRQHIVYYSSRWGFHQTLHSISISWQSIFMSALSDWNLLTLTHEYLHAITRDLFAAVSPLENPALLDALADMHRDAHPTSFGESLRLFLLQQLRWIDHGLDLASQVDESTNDLDLPVAREVSASEITELYVSHAWLLDEFLVHIFDFLYCYNQDDFAYVNSIWRSWSRVPGVANKLDEYVVRTLLALAVSYPQCDPPKAFEDARARLIGQWDAMLCQEPDPVIEAAKSHLVNGDRVGERARHRFISSYLLAWFVRCFLRDSRLHQNLTSDPDLQLGVDGYTYGLSVGEFPSSPIRSPIMFLLDCMNQEDRVAREDSERTSLWQLLALIS